MKVTGIIAEYNPFHNGHAYQLQYLKEQLKSDLIVVVMSGDFVQRGESAIVDKYKRAAMALSCGADLVLELPVLFSTASAPYFAYGGVSILDALPEVDTLCFGHESGNIDTFYQVAQILTDEPEEYQVLLNQHLKKGLSFPAARAKALEEFTDFDNAFLSSPNNILGIEYTKSLLSRKSSIHIEPIKRIGDDYHSEEISSLASATAIRHHIQKRQDTGFLSQAIPRTAYDSLTQEIAQNRISSTDSFSSILGYQLLKLDSPEKLTSYFDIDPFLANRIFQNRDRFQNISQFAELLKSKNKTLLHIKRSLLHILLNIEQPVTPSSAPYYTRILAMKKEASFLLRDAKIPVLSKLANASSVFSKYYEDEKDKEAALKQLAQTTFASNLYQMELARQTDSSFQHENTRQILIH